MYACIIHTRHKSTKTSIHKKTVKFVKNVNFTEDNGEENQKNNSANFKVFDT